MFRELISALSYMHLNKIAHRDLKPENMLLTASGDLKLADFGVSEDFSGDSGEGDVGARDGMVANTKGSWAFFSPEMIDADEDNKYDAYKADVWAAASCLWVFVFGALPFWQPHDPHNPQPIFDKITEAITALPPYPSRKSPELYNMFEKMFTIDPVARPSFTDCEDLQWIRVNTSAATQRALKKASSGVVPSDSDANKAIETQKGDVSTISMGVRKKFLSLALKSKHEVGSRKASMVTERRRTISDKVEVRKSLTRVYTTASSSSSGAAEVKRITTDATDAATELEVGDEAGDLDEVSFDLEVGEVWVSVSDGGLHEKAPAACCSVS